MTTDRDRGPQPTGAASLTQAFQRAAANDCLGISKALITNEEQVVGSYLCVLPLMHVVFGRQRRARTSFHVGT